MTNSMSQWQLLAIQACDNKMPQKFTKKLLLTCENSDLINFSSWHRKDFLRFLEAIQDRYQKCSLLDCDLDESKEGLVAMDLVQLFIKMVCALRGYDHYRIVAGCLFPHIANFIKRHLNLAITAEKKSMPSQFFTILEELQPCIKDMAYLLPNFGSFLESVVESVLDASRQIYHQTVLLIIPLFETSNNNQSIIQGIVNYVSNKTKNRFHYLGDYKVSSPVIFVVALVQHGLSFHPNNEICYQMGFTFAAYFIDTLSKKCKEKVKGMIDFFECLIRGLLQMLNTVDWPGARLMFHLVTKQLCNYMADKSDHKMMKFALKQMPVIGKVFQKLCLSWKELTKQLSVPDENLNETLKLLLTKFTLSKTHIPVVGNVNKANDVLWEYLKRPKNNPLQTPATECEYQMDSSQAAAAAYYLDYNKINYLNTLQSVLTVISYKIPDVNAVAVKSLGEIILFEPQLLLMQLVYEKIDDMLASNTMQHGIVSAMGVFFAAHPNHIIPFRTQFLQLLDDPNPRTRALAVKAIANVLKKPELLSNPVVVELLTKLLSLSEDDDVIVQREVLGFFKTAWLGKNANIESLIEVCKKPLALSYVGEMLSTLQCSQRAVCLSQVQKDVPKCIESSQDEIGNSIQDLVDSLVGYLSEVNKEHVETALAILLTIAKAIPSVVEPHFETILSKLTNLSETGKRLAADTLRSALLSVSDELKSNTAAILLVELDSPASLNWQIPTLASIIKLFLRSADKNQIEPIITSSLKTVEIAKDLSAPNFQEVKKALCFIYATDTDDSRKEKLLTHFIKDPQFNLTILSMACQVRMDIVPAKDTLLEKIAKKLLESSPKGVYTETALYFINCTLQGYKRQVQIGNELKDLGQTSTETVSNLLQNNLNNILVCSIDANEKVRKRCCGLLALIVESGLILMPRLLPHICAMTADPHLGIRSAAKKLLSRAAESWDISCDLVKGISLAYSLTRSLNPGISRGFDLTSGKATFNIAYGLIQESPSRRRKFMSIIANELLQTKDTMKALYIADQIARLPYNYSDEVLFALSEMNKLIALHIGEKYFALYLLKKVAGEFMSTYKVNHEKVSAYTPSKAKTTETLRKTNFDVDYLDEGVLSMISKKYISGEQELLPESDEGSDIEEDDVPLATIKRKLAEIHINEKMSEGLERTTEEENLPLVKKPRKLEGRNKEKHYAPLAVEKKKLGGIEALEGATDEEDLQSKMLRKEDGSNKESVPTAAVEQTPMNTAKGGNNENAPLEATVEANVDESAIIQRALEGSTDEENIPLVAVKKALKRGNVYYSAAMEVSTDEDVPLAKSLNEDVVKQQNLEEIKTADKEQQNVEPKKSILVPAKKTCNETQVGRKKSSVTFARKLVAAYGTSGEENNSENEVPPKLIPQTQEPLKTIETAYSSENEPCPKLVPQAMGNTVGSLKIFKTGQGYKSELLSKPMVSTVPPIIIAKTGEGLKVKISPPKNNNVVNWLMELETEQGRKSNIGSNVTPQVDSQKRSKEQKGQLRKKKLKIVKTPSDNILI